MGIYTKRGHLVADLRVIKTAKFRCWRIIKKYPIKYVRLNGKSHKPLQRYRKFLRKREFVKNSCVGICYLCETSPDLWCNRSGLWLCGLRVERKSFGFFSFCFAIVRSCQKCRVTFKVTLNCFCYVTLGLAACSVDLWGTVRWWLGQHLARQYLRLWFVIRLRWLWGGLLIILYSLYWNYV